MKSHAQQYGVVIVLLCLLQVAAVAQITRPKRISIEFGGSGSRLYQIPAGMMGAQLGWIPNGFYKNRAALHLLRQAGLSSIRVDALLHKIYATPTPDWSQIDPVIESLHAAEMQPLIVMGYTPSWLQPSPNPCPATGAVAYHALPNNIDRWAQLAGEFVAHMNRLFPDFIHEYEIWNEPDTPAGLCVAPNTDDKRRGVYREMYAAASRAMRAQALGARVQIRIGGPALGKFQSAGVWIPALLTNSITAAKVDFVSYHQYFGTASDLAAGFPWDGRGLQSLLSRTRDTERGAAAALGKVSASAKHSAHGEQLPVFLDEYNTTDSFQADCCRNSPVYAPVWNTLFVQQILNSVYRYHNRLPRRLMYFAAQDWFATDNPNTAWYCLFGTWNAAMDCAYDEASARPYPQYYALALLAGARYLNLASGGILATKVLTSKPLEVSGWRTAKQYSVVIANPTSILSKTQIKFKRIGSGTRRAKLFLLNGQNPEILEKEMTIRNGTFEVAVPGYSVVGIAILYEAASEFSKHPISR